MKKVVLLGDSIRMGYQPFVAQMLEGRAEVWGPEANCETSVRILTNLQIWIVDCAPDVLHLNCGLHDIKTLSWDSDELVVPLPFYRRNLDQIFAFARRKAPETKLIWSTTTPVGAAQAQQRRAQKAAFLRHNSAIDAANAAAIELCETYEIAVNDLNAFVKKSGPETLLSDDLTHYTEAGKVALARQVVEQIARQL